MSTVIRSPNWIGDGVMCLPAIRAFKGAFPEEYLAIAAKQYLADLFLNIPEIDEVIALPDHWSGFPAVRSLRKKRFARGILFTNSFSSALLFRLAGIRSLAGYARDGRGWMLTDKVQQMDHLEHHQFYYLDIVEHLSGKRIDRPYPAGLSVSAAEKEWADGWLQEMGLCSSRPLMAVSPTAAYGSAKAWLPDRYREFIRRWLLRFPETAVLLLGAAGEKEGIETVSDGLPGGVLNLAGRLDLRRSIAVLSRCRLFVGNDSGLMHIAAALAVPLVAIFGPTKPDRTAPLAHRFRLLHHGADCAPCRYRECPTDHRCMTAIAVDEVLAAAADLWKEEK